MGTLFFVWFFSKHKTAHKKIKSVKQKNWPKAGILFNEYL